MTDEASNPSNTNPPQIIPPEAKAKTPRKKRSASNYWLMGLSPLSVDNYVMHGEFRSPKAAWAAAVEQKLSGELVVVCLRGRKTGAVKEAFVLE